jgi:hypothetical protein
VANRPGNRPSHDGAVAWMDRAAAVVCEGGFERVIFRGDTDFSLTAKLDGWDDEGNGFAFGIDAMANRWPRCVTVRRSAGATTVW